MLAEGRTGGRSHGSWHLTGCGTEGDAEGGVGVDEARWNQHETEDRKGGAAPRAGPGDQGPARRPRGPEARASLGSKRQSAAGPSLSRSGQSPISLEGRPLEAKGGDATRPQEGSELGPGGTRSPSVTFTPILLP